MEKLKNITSQAEFTNSIKGNVLINEIAITWDAIREKLNKLAEQNKINEGKSIDALYENVTRMGDSWSAIEEFQVPVSLVSNFKKKVADDSGMKVNEQYSDQMIAEKILRYIVSNYMTIDNLPTSLLLGDNYKVGGNAAPAQSQPTDSAQPQSQPQSQPQPQPSQEGTRAAQGGQANQPAQTAAAAVPPTQGGTQSQTQPQPQSI